jgi:DNA topoisomerase I
VPRLRRSDLTAPGILRRRCGKGFQYRWSTGAPVLDEATRSRIRKLAIPPAWTDVWVCPWPNGHIQAIGVDAAGRRQYRYHDVWREHRDREKFERALRFANDLPRLRASVSQDLRRNELDRQRVLAALIRLLDLGAFRIGGMEYAETNETYGLVSLRREHVRVRDSVLAFQFPAKGSLERAFETTDVDVAEIIAVLKRRRAVDHHQLFAYKDGSGWHPMRTEDVNAHIKERCGPEYTAKDFRNWSATVLAASHLALAPVATSERARRRTVKGAVEAVAAHLGNTPAVCRSSYIDPRVIDRFAVGATISARAAKRMLRDQTNPMARQQAEAALVELLGAPEPGVLAA